MHKGLFRGPFGGLGAGAAQTEPALAARQARMASYVLGEAPRSGRQRAIYGLAGEPSYVPESGVVYGDDDDEYRFDLGPYSEDFDASAVEADGPPPVGEGEALIDGLGYTSASFYRKRMAQLGEAPRSGRQRAIYGLGQVAHGRGEPVKRRRRGMRTLPPQASPRARNTPRPIFDLGSLDLSVRTPRNFPREIYNLPNSVAVEGLGDLGALASQALARVTEQIARVRQERAAETDPEVEGKFARAEQAYVEAAALLLPSVVAKSEATAAAIAKVKNADALSLEAKELRKQKRLTSPTVSAQSSAPELATQSGTLSTASLFSGRNLLIGGGLLAAGLLMFMLSRR